MDSKFTCSMNERLLLRYSVSVWSNRLHSKPWTSCFKSWASSREDLTLIERLSLTSLVTSVSFSLSNCSSYTVYRIQSLLTTHDTLQLRTM